MLTFVFKLFFTSCYKLVHVVLYSQAVTMYLKFMYQHVRKGRICTFGNDVSTRSEIAFGNDVARRKNRLEIYIIYYLCSTKSTENKFEKFCDETIE